MTERAADMMAIVVELSKADAAAFQAAMAEQGLEADVSAEEQFFGESEMAVAVVNVVPAILNVAAVALAVFGSRKSIMININGKTISSAGLTEKGLEKAIVDLTHE